MKDVSGRVAAVTGAASGIGRALAMDLARRGVETEEERSRASELAVRIAACSAKQ